MTEDLFAVDSRAITLYPWQAEAVEALRTNIRAGTRNQILAAPTGSGKTVVGSYLIDECLTKGKRAVFVCDRIPLIDQTSRTFDEYGIRHGVIQADHWRYRPWERIQVASSQTLARRKWPDDLALIVVDECHTVHKTVAQRIAERDCITIGLSATPFTKGLGKLYDSVVTVRTLNQLTADGYLAPYRVWAASEPDMSGAKVVAGEWTEKEAESRAMPIIGDIVSEYLKHAAGTKFIAPSA
jgi:DNA repair protein RadD